MNVSGVKNTSSSFGAIRVGHVMRDGRKDLSNELLWNARVPLEGIDWYLQGRSRGESWTKWRFQKKTSLRLLCGEYYILSKTGEVVGSGWKGKCKSLHRVQPGRGGTGEGCGREKETWRRV